MKLTLLFPLLMVVLSQATEAQAQVERAAPPAEPAPKGPFQTAYLRLNVGTTFDALKYYRCARVAVEYAPMLTRHVGLAGRLAGVAGTPSASNLYGTWIDQMPNQNYKAGYAEAEALYYPFGNQKRVRFAVGAGGFVGYRLNSWTKLKYFENGNTYKDKDYGNYGLNDWQYGLQGVIGYHGLTFFAKYNLNELFREGQGPQAQTLSFGVRLGG